jgi:alpha(1,3/1,4) fucosyltransferase
MIYANVYADERTNNSLFALEDDVHRFNPTYTPRLLREAFLAHGIELNTVDLNVGREIAFELYIEGRPYVDNGIPKFLLALENPYINPLNESAVYCSNFVKVFAWDLRLYHLSNVTPIYIPHPLIQNPFLGFEQRTIFSCLINANKAFRHMLPNDLYMERIQTIRWYEKYAPKHFELYGMGWEKSTPAFDWLGKLKRIIPRLKTKLFGVNPYPSYRGEVANKTDVLQRAKFSYCYENTKDVTNYVSEKIFDSLVNGCIPIYWGSDNIHELIPSNCFIDRRNFADTAAVHQYLLSVTEAQFNAYQAHITAFLQSDAAKQFSSQHVVSVIVKNVIANVQNFKK